MADTLDVVDLDEAKDAVAGGSADYDALLPAWITGVSRRLDRLVGPIVQRTITGEQHDGGWHDIDLTWWPITSVTSVTEYDDTTSTALSEETNASKTADDYLLERWAPDPTLYTGRIRRRSNNGDATFPTGRNNVEVTYVAGRFADTSSVDEKYKTGARLMLQHLTRSIQPDTFATSVDGIVSNQRVTLGFAVPASVKDLLHGELQDSPGFS